MSGLLLFARSAAAAAALCRKIEGREVEKMYVARVLGRFPGEKALGEDLSMVCVSFVRERVRVRVPVRVHWVGQVWPDREISRARASYGSPRGLCPVSSRPPPVAEGPVVADVPLDWDPVANMASAVPEAAAALSAQQAASAAQQQGAAGGVDAAGCASQRQDAQQVGSGGQPQQGAEQLSEQAAGQQHNDPGAQLSKAEERRQRKQQKKAAKAAKAERQAAAVAAATAASANKSSRSAPKPALTEFRLLAVAEDGLTSIVECRCAGGRRPSACPLPRERMPRLQVPNLLPRQGLRGSPIPGQPRAIPPSPALAPVCPAGLAPAAPTRFGCTCSTWGTLSPTTPSMAAPMAARWPAATWRSS